MVEKAPLRPASTRSEYQTFRCDYLYRHGPSAGPVTPRKLLPSLACRAATTLNACRVTTSLLSARNDDDDTCHNLVPSTGANRQALDASGAQYFTVHTHTSQHAGYFPGAKPVHILMHVGADGQILGAQAVGADGQILGAQAVGADGVDRHIDVIATAMRAGLKATDLIDLDLAYAPPYGQAKDPVNQTGMVAHNVLTGELVLTGPNELAEDMPVLDVRTPGEYAAGHMPNSLNIPHTQLRAWLGDRVEAVLVTGEG